MNSLEPVVIELEDNNKNEISLTNSGYNTQSSTNFGGGIELLMNEKKRGGSSNKMLGDLS